MRVWPNLLLGSRVKEFKRGKRLADSLLMPPPTQRAGDCILVNTFEEENEITDDAAMQLLTAF